MAALAMALGVLSVGALPAGSAWAQSSSPDAGSLRQQIERDLGPAPLPSPSAPLQTETPSPAPSPGTLDVKVKRFQFSGNRLLDDEQLQLVVAEWVDRSLSFDDLRQVVRAVAGEYRAAGWIVNAYLPKQDVTDGVVTIQIVESMFSGAHLEAPEPTHVAPSIPLARITAQQAVDQPLRVDNLDRGLLLADDLPGVSVSGALEPGAAQGQTRLAVRAKDEPWVAGNVMADNAGARAIGAARIVGSVALNSPLRIGDLARVDALHTRGSDFVRLGYSVPVGNDGWRVGINASHLDYRLVGDQFAALDGRGNSISIGLDTSYPLIRSRLRNLYLTLAADDKRYRNKALGTTQSDYRVRSGTVGLSGNLFDRLGGGGGNTAHLSLTAGRAAQGTLDAGENPRFGGRFNKLRYGLAREQTVTSTVSVYGSLSGQHATQSLDSSERFYLGGPDGVRAYPVNEGSGSRGELATIEARWRLPAGLVASAFYDWGHVTNFDSGPSVTLKGPGASIGWTGPHGLNLKATVAVRHGRNPNPTAAGTDQDGSLHRVRLWLQASIPF